MTRRNLAIADLVDELGSDRATASQVAVAWALAQERRSAIISIVGARTKAQLEDTPGVFELELIDDEIEQLDQPPRSSLPHEFGGTLANGDRFERIDDRRLVERAVSTRRRRCETYT
jgi:diketogulonate reductase-like aldo/keto reductase